MPLLFSSGPVNAILASADVLVAQQLRTRQGNRLSYAAR